MNMNNPHGICVYTDGSVKNNPGISGQGSVIVYPDGKTKEICNYGYRHSTISCSELSACIEVLRFLQKDEKARGIDYVSIYSDSRYVVDNYKKAIFGTWQNNNWKTLDGHDVDNQDLWKDLAREMRKIGKRVEIFKVKAHSGNKYNDKADSLAKESRKNAFKTDFNRERKQVRRWLPIPEAKINVNLKRALTLFIQRTDPRKELFDAHVQVLRPKKYFGARMKIRGRLNDHALRGGHIYKIKLEKKQDFFEIKNIIGDLGKSSENRELFA